VPVRMRRDDVHVPPRKMPRILATSPGATVR
jgi:hypothetical protein